MPLPTKAVVHKIADDVTAGRLDADAEIAKAFDASDGARLTELLLSVAVAGRPASAEQVARALPLLDDFRAAGPIAQSCGGDGASALLDAVERGRMTQDREAAALWLATEIAGRKPPARAARLLRTVARRCTSWDSAAVAVATARAIGDAHALDVVRETIGTVDERDIVDMERELRKTLSRSPIDSLPDSPEPRVTSGATVKRAAPKVGRNDPCPCGSGKKYKRCHGAAAAAASEDGPSSGGTVAQPNKDQVHDMSVPQLQALDLRALPDDTLLAVYRRLALLRMWSDAERALAAIAERTKDADRIESHREELVYFALYARDLAVAHAQAEKLRGPQSLSPQSRAMFQAAEPTADSLAKLDEMALAGLRGDDPAALFDVADALLAHRPALGVVFGRGVLDPERAADSITVLEDIEEARDRLALPPGDIANDFYDLLEGGAAWEAAPRGEATDEEREKAVAEAQELRERVHGASAHIAELESRLKEQRKRLAQAESTRAGQPAAEPARAREDEEAKRLRSKVDKLQALIAEGNEERAKMRRELAEKSESLGPREGEARAAAEEEEPESEEEAGGAEAQAPRGVAVPRLSRTAEDALRTVPARSARDALVRIAGIATGDPIAWRDVKQLERAREPLLSARVGIHYRLLLRIHDGVLDVLELVHRKELETAIKRYV